MELRTLPRFDRMYLALPTNIQKRVDRTLERMEENIRHPSLRLGKLRGHRNIWEVSVTMKYRITFEIHMGFYRVRAVGEHDKVLRNP